MTVTGVQKDPAARTLTIASEFAAGAERVWRLWADPRQLERWWGPPTHPATVVEHDLRPGGKVTYFVTGPEGERIDGWWRVLAVDAPRRLAFEMGSPGIPAVMVRVTVDDRDGGGTRMIIESSFESDDIMEQMLSIGFDEGMSLAISQIDDVLAAAT
jgi:uncharacterized protein YndB with AHSA1/START domain